MSLTAAQRSAGLTALADLEQQRQGALYSVLGTLSADETGKGAKPAAVSYFRDTVPLALASLKNRLDLDRTDWRTWVIDASQLHRDMTEVLGYRDEWSMSSVLFATGEQTVKDAGQKAQAIGAGAELGAGVFTFLLLGFIAWKVLR